MRCDATRVTRRSATTSVGRLSLSVVRGEPRGAATTAVGRFGIAHGARLGARTASGAPVASVGDGFFLASFAHGA